MKKFIADPSFWSLFPQAAIGVLTVRDVDEAAKLTGEQAAEVAALLKSANAAAMGYLEKTLPLSQNRVVAVWREAYQRFPTKKGARCSIEALLKRVSKGEPVGAIAPTVDITNAVSLKYALPIGVENMAAFQGDLHLGVMAGGEDFLQQLRRIIHRHNSDLHHSFHLPNRILPILSRKKNLHKEFFSNSIT